MTFFVSINSRCKIDITVGLITNTLNEEYRYVTNIELNSSDQQRAGKKTCMQIFRKSKKCQSSYLVQKSKNFRRALMK